MAVNHLKNSESQRKYLAAAFGRQKVAGYLCWSKVEGASPTHQITAYNALGEGEWDSCEAAYYKGVLIPPADYHFHPGALATGMTSGPQQVDSFFDKDVPHSRTAAIGYKAPVGLGSADIENTPPTDFKGIFRTKKCPDFNDEGIQTNFSYSPNPARCIIEGLLTYARLPNLPSSYQGAAAYWLSRIDWGNWVDFRDYHNGNETVDYTTIPDFEGFGLTANYYNGLNFDTFVRKFVEPTINLNPGTVSLVAGVDVDNFSARFEGKIKARYSETYTFHLTFDDNARLYVNNTLVIDTHVFLWFVSNAKELSQTARNLIEDGQNEIFLSIASLWEISIKTAKPY